MHSVELLHPDLPELIDALLRRNRWSWQALERGDLKLGDEILDVDRLQWWLINADPVLWVETNLVNKPEDGGGLWKLFPYQRPSLRFRGHVVHQDGAEVGKSREIVGLLLWGCLAAERGSTLVGSALDGDLDEIWEEVEWQLSANPFLASSLRNRTTKPYRRLTWRNGLRMLFRPAGHDGRAYRGIHVRGFLLHDEAAKVVNPRSWSEFWRAAKPGAEIRIYSVPTGDRLCTFQRIADNAVPAESIVPADTPELAIEQLLRPGASIAEGTRTLARDLGGRTWVRFHWPKTSPSTPSCSPPEAGDSTPPESDASSSISSPPSWKTASPATSSTAPPRPSTPPPEKPSSTPPPAGKSSSPTKSWAPSSSSAACTAEASSCPTTPKSATSWRTTPIRNPASPAASPSSTITSSTPCESPSCASSPPTGASARPRSPPPSPPRTRSIPSIS